MKSSKKHLGVLYTNALFLSANIGSCVQSRALQPDGALGKLSQVIEHYNKGGNPQDKNQEPLVVPLHLSDREKTDLGAFIKTLTDPSLDRISAPELPLSNQRHPLPPQAGGGLLLWVL